MISTPRSRFLEVNELGALEHLRFTTRYRIEGAYSGRHRSRRRGGSGEFMDHREYVEGEDLRQLDWKILARTGRAYLRTYQEETELNCMLMLDVSRSMSFPEGRGYSEHPPKLEYAQYLSTAIAHVIIRQQDQVGLGLIGRGLTFLVKPGGTPSHAAHVQEQIAGIETEGASALGSGLKDAFSQLPRPGVMMLISDFLVDDIDGLFSAIRMFRHRHWEIVLLHLVHPLEETLPRGRAFRFLGLEGEGAINGSPHEIAVAYQTRFGVHCDAIRAHALAAGCEYHRVSTAVPYLQTMRGFLVERHS